MRVLLLTQKLPLPIEDGYNLRIHHYARRIGRRHSLTLLSLDDGAISSEQETFFRRVVRAPLRKVPAPGLGPGRLIRALDPSNLHDRDPEVAALVRDVVRNGRFDVVWISGWMMLLYQDELVDGRGALPIFGDIVDEGAREAWTEHEKSDGVLERLLTWKRARVIEAFERKFFRPLALCNLVSDADAHAVQGHCSGVKTSVVHNGVDPSHFDPEPYTSARAVKEPPTLVFEGTMSFRPNVEAVVWFAEKVLPRIQSELPETRFIAVGRDPVDAVKAVASDSVEVTGTVDDVRPYLARATAFVSPLIGGAGIKNKVLQAWAMEKAVAATPLSIGGLQAQDGENILLADGAEGLAGACLQLLRDPDLRVRLGRAGRETVKRHYSWDAKAEELEALLASVARSAEAP